jgi:hypothetical protein
MRVVNRFDLPTSRQCVEVVLNLNDPLSTLVRIEIRK